MSGNVMLVKHAPGVPQCALAFERILRDAGVPEGVYTNLFSAMIRPALSSTIRGSRASP
jgi:acyl-CoA reductase-like NAD-dependent aldehyde dehydrogenase